MEPDKHLLEAWQNGARLVDAWWIFATPSEKQLFLSLQSEDLHLEFVQSLKDQLIERLYAGQLYAFGVESKSDSGLARIPTHYFLKTAKIDWDRSFVGALGKEFHNVRVQAAREQADEASKEPQVADPGLADPEVEPVLRLPLTDRSLANPGRPSKIDEIEQAIDILLKKGIDLAAMPRPQAYKAVRKCAAAELNSNTKIGFSDPVIQRSLHSRFGPRR